MGRRHPGKQIFSSYQRRGEWAELLFMTVASGLGFTVAKPWGQPRYDVAIELNGRFLRIQVKSTEMWLGTCYRCQLHRHGQPNYTTKQVDYFAIYVFPEDIWYIFPAKALARKRMIALTPHLKGHKYEPYMENWWYLVRPHAKRHHKTVIPADKTTDKASENASQKASKKERVAAMTRVTARILKRLDSLAR
jgi:hypothetical protein